MLLCLLVCLCCFLIIKSAYFFKHISTWRYNMGLVVVLATDIYLSYTSYCIACFKPPKVLPPFPVHWRVGISRIVAGTFFFVPDTLMTKNKLTDWLTKRKTNSFSVFFWNSPRSLNPPLLRWFNVWRRWINVKVADFVVFCYPRSYVDCRLVTRNQASFDVEST